MGKAGRNAARRTAANFLNGIAVATLAAGCIGPALTQDADLWISALAVLASALLHAMALHLVSNLED